MRQKPPLTFDKQQVWKRGLEGKVFGKRILPESGGKFAKPPKRKVEIVFSKQDANEIRTIGRMKCRPFREPERDITLLFQRQNEN